MTVLRELLCVIADWRLPETGEVWPSGGPMSYEACYGSNGARDYMRGMAKQAIQILDAEGDGGAVDGDAPCAKCGSVSVDTGFECNDCGHDNAPTAEPVAQGEALVCALCEKTTPHHHLRGTQPHASPKQPTKPCPACDGMGNIMDMRCIGCDGAGRVPEQPAGRQGEYECPNCGAPCSKQRVWDEAGGYYRYSYTHPAAPMGVPDAWPKLELWFFRELVEAQRLKLFALHGMPVDEIGASHIHQKRALRQLLAAAPSQGEPKACNRDCDCVGPCKMGIEG